MVDECGTFSYTNVSRHTWMRHVTNVSSRHFWMRLVTYEWVMSRSPVRALVHIKVGAHTMTCTVTIIYAPPPQRRTRKNIQLWHDTFMYNVDMWHDSFIRDVTHNTWRLCRQVLDGNSCALHSCSLSKEPCILSKETNIKRALHTIKRDQYQKSPIVGHESRARKSSHRGMLYSCVTWPWLIHPWRDSFTRVRWIMLFMNTNTTHNIRQCSSHPWI